MSRFDACSVCTRAVTSSRSASRGGSASNARHSVLHETVRYLQVQESPRGAARNLVDYIPSTVKRGEGKLLQRVHKKTNTTIILITTRIRTSFSYLPRSWGSLSAISSSATMSNSRTLTTTTSRTQRTRPTRSLSRNRMREECNEVVLQEGRCARLHHDHQGLPSFRPGHGLR